MSKHPPTTLNRDDDEWWHGVFSESEYTILERMFGAIIAEQDDPDDLVEIELNIRADTYTGILLKLMPLHGTGNNALDELIETLCMVYAEDDRIESDNEINMFMESVARDYGDENDD